MNTDTAKASATCEDSYLLIENQGEAELSSLTLMGASTKRSHADSIGMFGTGSKYALSVLMREDIEVVMFFGSKRIGLDVEKVALRGETFHQIVLVDGDCRVPTNFTTEMGLKWKLENALREIVSNAIDEKEFMVARCDSEPRPLKGYTRIFIKMSPAIEKFYSTRGQHFLALRKEKPKFKAPGVELWPRISDRARVYRRGVLVFVHDKYEGLFDYNFDELELAEDRTASQSNVDWAFSSVVDSFPTAAKRIIVENIERDTFEAHNAFMEYRNLSSADWKEITADKIIAPTEVYDHMLHGEVPRESIVRTTSGWSKALKTAACRDVRDFVSKAALEGFNQVELTDFDLDALSAAIAFINKSGGASVDVKDVRIYAPPKGAEANTMGYWCPKTKLININKSCFERGRRYLTEVILEEAFHRDSGLSDKTRAFQDYLFMKLVHEMERRIGTIEEE